MVTHVNLLFNDDGEISLSTSSFLFKQSKLFQSFDIEEDNYIPIICSKTYVTKNDAVLFDDKPDLSFMFTLQSNKFLEVCKFLDIICYENDDILYSKEFITYIMTNIKEEINIIKYFMQPEIRSIMNYINNEDINIQIKICTPTFYMLFLTEYKEEVIKHNRSDIYKLLLNKDDYFIYIYKYDNHLTLYVKETQEYKFFIKNFRYNINNYLFDACKLPNNLIKIKELVAHGANINMRDKYEKTILHYASKQKNNLDIIQYIIEHVLISDELKCADYINIQDYRGKTALHHACKKHNNLNVIQYLVGKGANIHLQNTFGNTALHFAAKHIDNTIDITQKENNNLETIKYLIRLGANINLQNNQGNTVLHYATKTQGNIEIIKYLVEQGANVNLQNIFGDTILYNAFQNNNLEIVQYLVENGTDVNLQNRDGSMLHIALHRKYNLNIIKYLVEHGADIHLKNNKNETSLQIALHHSNYTDVINYLQHVISQQIN